MTTNQFINTCRQIETYMRDASPFDTGNMSLKAITFNLISENEIEISVETDGKHIPKELDGVADYMKFVNDSQFVGASTAQNKNYHWWNKAIEQAVTQTAASLGNAEVQKNA